MNLNTFEVDLGGEELKVQVAQKIGVPENDVVLQVPRLEFAIMFGTGSWLTPAVQL